MPTPARRSAPPPVTAARACCWPPVTSPAARWPASSSLSRPACSVTSTRRSPPGRPPTIPSSKAAVPIRSPCCRTPPSSCCCTGWQGKSRHDDARATRTGRIALSVIGMRVRFFSAALLIPGAVIAAEGMWPLDNLPVSRLQAEYNFTPGRNWVDHVMRASARIAGGCSASFVSKDGLVMTNHHCAAACVSQLSTAKKNFVVDGFLARSRGEEVPCPEIELNRLERISDVTGEVKGAVAGLDGEAFKLAKNAVEAKLSSACVGAERETARCDVVDLYHGGRYHLYRYHRFQDDRLVWLPEQAIP